MYLAWHLSLLHKGAHNASDQVNALYPNNECLCFVSHSRVNCRREWWCGLQPPVYYCIHLINPIKTISSFSVSFVVRVDVQSSKSLACTFSSVFFLYSHYKDDSFFVFFVPAFSHSLLLSLLLSFFLQLSLHLFIFQYSYSFDTYNYLCMDYPFRWNCCCLCRRRRRCCCCVHCECNVQIEKRKQKKTHDKTPLQCIQKKYQHNILNRDTECMCVCMQCFYGWICCLTSFLNETSKKEKV